MTELETGGVQCYSGHTYAGEPRLFVWEERSYRVAEVEARWRTPEGPAFRVQTGSGECFDLHYHEAGGRWTIVPLPGCHSPAHVL